MAVARKGIGGNRGTLACGDLTFESTGQFKYLGTLVTAKNDIWVELKNRLRSGNVCFRALFKLLSSKLLSRNTKIRIYRTLIVPVLLYGCEAWSLTLSDEAKFRVFENRVLRKIYGPIQDSESGEW